jgi:hypothetical protein
MNFAPAELTGTRPVTLIHALSPTSPLGEVKDELLHRLSQIALGQEVVANVQSKLTDGSFLVKLADTVAKMNLPASTEVGSKLSLTLVGKEPRPTFTINQAPESIPPSINSTPTAISNTAHLISTLLQKVSQQAPAMVLAKSNSVLMNPSTPVQTVAQSLQQAITQSGVFYESHLASWASGQMNVTQLMLEPQGQLSPRLESPPPNPLTQTPQQVQPKTADIFSNPMLQTLVNTQLQTLEQNHIVWQGNAWPGQTMQWEITQDTPQRNQQQNTSQPSWRSDVKFELPTLGNVAATLRITSGHLSIQIQAENADSEKALQANTPSLINALAAAGIPLDAIAIKAAIADSSAVSDAPLSQSHE